MRERNFLRDPCEVRTRFENEEVNGSFTLEITDCKECLKSFEGKNILLFFQNYRNLPELFIYVINMHN